MQTARNLVADALRLRISDSIVIRMQERVVLLESEKLASYKSFSNLLNLSEQKYNTQKEITGDFSRLADSWRKEADYYQKRYRKQRRQKNVLAYGLVGVIILILVK